MYYNGGYDNKHVSEFLGIVHRRMNAKYSKKNEQLKANAQTLEKFLRELKLAANQGNSSEFFHNEILDAILQGIKSHLRGNTKVETLFRKRGNSYLQGKRFEDDLTNVVLTIMEQVAADPKTVSRKEINIGTRTGSPLNDLHETIDDMGNEIVEGVGEELLERMRKNDTNALKEFYSKNVQGKIDVRGYEIEVNAQATPKMLEIYELLKDATFSAKSYSSMTWDQALKEMVSTSRKAITLGHSHFYRAFSGPLLDLGYDIRTTNSAIFAGENMVGRKENVAQHFFHLRYIYELTGSGIIYTDGGYLGEVKYLIYNDPASDEIYVKSAAEILEDILSNYNFEGNPFNAGAHIAKIKFASQEEEEE